MATFPPPGAPPFLASYWFESKTEPHGFEMSLYMKGPTSYIDAMTQAVDVLNTYLYLLVPDIHCMKCAVKDSDPTVLGDSWIRFFLTGEKSGAFAPTAGADISALDYQTGIQQRYQNTVTGVHETRHLHPIPRTLVTDGKTLVPDAFYEDALGDWEAKVVDKVVMVTKSPGGSALQSNVSEVIENFHVTRVPGGEPHFLKRGRARNRTVVPGV